VTKLCVCAGCGGTIFVERVDVTTLGDPSLRYMDGWVVPCDRCGGTMVARWAVHSTPEIIVIHEYGSVVRVAVHAGPPAPYPHIPSHEEWLAAYGLLDPHGYGV
jgi:hypothetical protein